MINDISALCHDSQMLEVVESFSGQVLIMHMQGTPNDMQVDPRYKDVVDKINSHFAERIHWLEKRGVEQSRIIVDPGIGFGKSLQHNLTILLNIKTFKCHGCPALIGHSRKSFLGQLLELSVEERDWPTAMISVFAEKEGADIVRVHQVGVTSKALRLMEALSR